MASITSVDICKLIIEAKKINQYTSNLPVTYFVSMMNRIMKNHDLNFYIKIIDQSTNDLSIILNY